MECFKCHHMNEPHAKFCSNCGKNFQTKKHNVSNENKNKTSIYPNSEAVAMHEAKLKERANNPVAVTVIFAIFYLLGWGLTQNILGFGMVSVVITLFFLICLFATKNVTQQYYYSLPGSKDSEGNHKCIFCGNKGIYKSTIYQTNTVVNACSKCQKPLFRS